MSRKHKHGGQTKRKDDELFVFGYASKLFRDDKTAAIHGEGKHLIPWPGDSSLLIDRYDCRLLFTEHTQFVHKPGDSMASLSPEEQEVEQMCDKERYLELSTNLEEYDIEQEEEMKRFKEALSEDGAYNAVRFSYEQDSNNGDPSAMQSADHPIQEPEPVKVVEKFVAPDDLEVPDGMEIPDTAKMNAIIDKTALFVSQHSTQMEILVKTKQAGNPQFDFLNFDNWLNPYYKHMMKYIREGKYTPHIESQSSPKQDEQEPESESEDDSDGEFELHPLLTASHRSATCTPNSSAPSSPVSQVANVEEEMNTHYVPTTGLAQTYSDDVPVTYAMYSTAQHVDYQSVWATQHSQVNYHYGSGCSQLPTTQYGSVSTGPIHMQSAADMLPPPPPPPGEGPLEGEWPGSEVSNQQNVQPQYHNPSSIGVPTVHGSALMSAYPSMMQGIPTAPIVPPPPDVLPIVDKLANYVAKNGHDFENIIKAKSDPRFPFIHPWNKHHSYYLYKKRLCIELIEQEKRMLSTKEPKNTGPISFSIKPKEVQKPKIEYRTNVIYKQSFEQGESEDDENKEEIEETDHENEVHVEEKGSTETNENKCSSKSHQDEQPDNDVEDQMKSVAAAEKEAQRLEAECHTQREKQLQVERRRKASLFISMLKKTTGSDEQSDGSGSERAARWLPDGNQQTRKFSENKRPNDTRIDMFEDKKPRYDNEDVSAPGVGAPPADIIRVTQDLMAKVRAASRTNR